MRLCACGCGRRVTGRRNRWYFSTACRMAATRKRRLRYHIQIAEGGARRPGRPKTDTNRVTDSDTNVKISSVHCSGCRKTLPKLIGPLPCAAFCKQCVADGTAEEYVRRPWHSNVYA